MRPLPPAFARTFFARAVVFAHVVFAGAALAQDRGALEARVLPPLANPQSPSTPAKELFGRADAPAPLAARTIGFYSRGCLAGGQALPISGDAWQVMRLSRNRNWGHPQLIAFLESFARRVRAGAGWPGILVGDISQPRGGPMLTGHASHQIGLDADIWMTPMPARQLSRAEREDMSSTMVVRPDRLDVDYSRWTPGHMEAIKLAAQDPRVQRVFVNAAIKKAICRDARGDRSWLGKVRPIWGHDYHFHIRLACPRGEDACRDQEPTPPGDGCDASLDWWFSDAVLHPKPSAPQKPKPPMTLAQLPAECRIVLKAK
ncbi:penicillin-insensitive murein endopeptidase [Methylocella sp.]|uniref:penicillin-insensitive murein endopeptidase n=1 Tax=Methylocella sp. TaxID=1978226 RepID=UPI0037834696